jgi:hypothetical protein
VVAVGVPFDRVVLPMAHLYAVHSNEHKIDMMHDASFLYEKKISECFTKIQRIIFLPKSTFEKISLNYNWLYF